MNWIRTPSGAFVDFDKVMSIQIEEHPGGDDFMPGYYLLADPGEVVLAFSKHKHEVANIAVSLMSMVAMRHINMYENEPPNPYEAIADMINTLNDSGKTPQEKVTTVMLLLDEHLAELSSVQHGMVEEVESMRMARSGNPDGDV